MTSDVAISALLAEHPVIDGHNDLLWEARRQAAYDFTRLDVGTGGTPTHTDLPRMRAGGMGAQFWSVYVPCRLTGDDAVSATLEQVDAARHLTGSYADQLAWATTADEVEAAWGSGRMASLMGARWRTRRGGSRPSAARAWRGSRTSTAYTPNDPDRRVAAYDMPASVGGGIRQGMRLDRCRMPPPKPQLMSYAATRQRAHP